MRAVQRRRGGAVRRYDLLDEDFRDPDFFAGFFFDADFFALDRFDADLREGDLRADARFEADFFDDDLFAADFLDDDFFAADFLDDDFLVADFFDDFFDRFGLGGAFPPALRASDNPMAIACLRLVTFLPERPLRSLPSLRSSIALLTFACAFLPYFAMSFLRFASWTVLRDGIRQRHANGSREPASDRAGHAHAMPIGATPVSP